MLKTAGTHRHAWTSCCAVPSRRQKHFPTWQLPARRIARGGRSHGFCVSPDVKFLKAVVTLRASQDAVCTATYEDTGVVLCGSSDRGLWFALASVNARVRGMEEQVGVALLERGGRGVEPPRARHARQDVARSHLPTRSAAISWASQWTAHCSTTWPCTQRAWTSAGDCRCTGWV